MAVAARNSLAETPTPGREATWVRVKGQAPDEDQTSVSTAAVAAVVTSTSDSEKGSGSKRRPMEEFDH